MLPEDSMPNAGLLQSLQAFELKADALITSLNTSDVDDMPRNIFLGFFVFAVRRHASGTPIFAKNFFGTSLYTYVPLCW